jgi:hypothetical protein
MKHTIALWLQFHNNYNKKYIGFGRISVHLVDKSLKKTPMLIQNSNKSWEIWLLSYLLHSLMHNAHWKNINHNETPNVGEYKHGSIIL